MRNLTGDYYSWDEVDSTWTPAGAALGSLIIRAVSNSTDDRYEPGSHAPRWALTLTARPLPGINSSKVKTD